MSDGTEFSEISEASERSSAVSEAKARDGYRWVQLGPKNIEIPEEWNAEKILDLCEINPYSFNPDGHNSETFEYVDIESVSPGQIDQSKTTLIEEAPSRAKRRIAAGNTLVAKVRPYLRAFAPVTDEYDGCVCSTGFAVLKAQDGISPKYITQTTLSKYFLDQMTNRMTGTSYPAVNKSDFQNIQVLTPPLAEQHRIAEVLSTVDEQIRQTETIIEKTKSLKQGLIQDLVFFGTEHGKTREIHIGPKPVEIADSWEIKRIGDVTSTVQYGCSESLSKEGRYPIFRMNNIEDGRMVAEPMKYADLDHEAANKYRVEHEDILFNRTNSIDLVGKAGIFNLDGEFIFASYLIRLQTTNEMNPWYLNYFINSSIGQDVMFSIATRGASQANINATNLKNVRIPVPPRDEQDDIVERIGAIKTKIIREKATKQRFQELKHGLIQDLLTGTARVPESIEVED